MITKLMSRFQSWLPLRAHTIYSQPKMIKSKRFGLVTHDIDDTYEVDDDLSPTNDLAISAMCLYKMGKIPTLKGIEQATGLNHNSYSADQSD